MSKKKINYISEEISRTPIDDMIYISTGTQGFAPYVCAYNRIEYKETFNGIVSRHFSIERDRGITGNNTDIDYTAHCMMRALKELFPTLAIIAEERAPKPEKREYPADGFRETNRQNHHDALKLGVDANGRTYMAGVVEIDGVNPHNWIVRSNVCLPSVFSWDRLTVPEQLMLNTAVQIGLHLIQVCHEYNRQLRELARSDRNSGGSLEQCLRSRTITRNHR